MSNVPFRLLIQQKLAEILDGITSTGKYSYNLEGRVFRGRNIFGDNDPIPLVSILEAPLPDEPRGMPAGGGHRLIDYDLYIQGWVDDDKDNPTDPAFYLASDVIKALSNERRKGSGNGVAPNLLGLGRRVVDIKIKDYTVRPAEEFASSYANFMLMVTLQIAEDLFDPYK